MNYNKWEPFYANIIADFSFSKEKDRKAAMLLNTLLKKHQHFIPLSNLTQRVHNNHVVIVGTASTVKKQITHHASYINSHFCISADGATTALLEQEIIPDIIVTDLDGIIAHQLEANKKGSILVVHAHGDNASQIKNIVPCIPAKVSGTTQTDPSMFSHLDNVGGFTDGDRAVFLADHFHAASISLIGFDFHGPIGIYSNPTQKNLKVKRKKLLWAEHLITHLNQKGHIHYL